LINEYIKQGAIVPVEITVNLIKKAMQEAGWEKKRYLIDGFPRNQDNYDGWCKVMGDDVRVTKCLFFKADEGELIKRIEERGKTSGRVDDNAESMKKRLITFNKESIPIVEMLEAKSPGLVSNIDAMQSVDKVFEDIQKVLKLTP